ncbi:helix-turn-helix domain-containing protein [Streptomyces sp. NPDC091271]|uniref:helix-turn-helix domain-containing protein n=1 Tax=Streptomyces sp. NPDC091271 TaxID=3365980 RepID=UPI0038033BA0
MAEPLSLGRLGHEVGASERTLSRLFQQETGMSFPQWRTQLRVHHPCRTAPRPVPALAPGRRQDGPESTLRMR